MTHAVIDRGSKPLTLALALWAAALGAPAQADLQPISESEMADVTGQAYISIDKYYNPNPVDSTSYTRINLGMDIETLLSADVLELGRYERDGEAPGSSDVLINNFALGYIYDAEYFRRNPDAIRPTKPDGSSYQNGEIVPFKITDPFLEFAMDEETGQLVGARIGFGNSMGVLSGDITYLTGNVAVDILDRGEGLRVANSNGNIIDRLIGLLTPLLEGESPIYTKAELVDAQGNRDPVRARMIGVPTGERFTLRNASGFTRWSLKNLLGPLSSSQYEVPGCNGIFDCPSGDIHLIVDKCVVLGIQSCFDLGIYRSFTIGKVEERNGQRYLVDSMPGAFISFQTKDLQWLADIRKENPDPADFIRATSGAFFNVPNTTVQVNLEEALYGTERVRTEFINRGRGLF